MTTTITIGKQLNQLFEEVYNLFDEAIMIPEYLNLDNKIIENQIIKFMDTVKVESEWDMNEEDRKGFGTLYFESGHNGVNAIYYPFDNNETDIKNILFTVNKLLEVWEDSLDIIINFSNNEEHVKQAENLIEQINKYILTF